MTKSFIAKRIRPSWLLTQHVAGDPRDLVMVFEGEAPEGLQNCTHCGRDLDRRSYPQFEQRYLDCPVCQTTWSVGYDGDA